MTLPGNSARQWSARLFFCHNSLMVTIAEGFTTCIEGGDCLDITTSPTPNSALYAELDIDPDGGIRCTVNGLAVVGGANLADPPSPSCGVATPPSPQNALGILADGSPFIPDHFVGDKLQAFAFGLPAQPAIPLNTYSSLIPTVQVNNNWCRDAQLMGYVYNNANVATDAGNAYDLRSEVALDAAPFVPIQHTPIRMANSPTILIQQDKATSASIFTDPYGFNNITIPSGGFRTLRLRTGVFGSAPGASDLWANVGNFVFSMLVTI